MATLCYNTEYGAYLGPKVNDLDQEVTIGDGDTHWWLTNGVTLETCKDGGWPIAGVERWPGWIDFISGSLSRATSGSAGYDIRASEPRLIPAGERVLVPTGIRTRFDPAMVGMIRGRSSLEMRGIITLAGTIDSDYNFEWFVVLWNTTLKDFQVQEGDRIAQVLWLMLADVGISSNDRRVGGFGSTGR